MKSQDYWRKRVLYAKQKQLDAANDYEAAMRSRLKDLENEFVKEAQSWLSKYAKENDQTLSEAAKYLSQIDTTKFDMTLAEFEAKARAGGFEKELNSAYYKTRIARLQELYRQYQELAARYADNEEDNMAIGLAKRYEDTYLLENYNKYLVVGGLDVNFTHFNEQELKDIVYQPWKGSNFSKRIWNNYTKVMPEVLTDTMFRSTALGYSYNRIERMLRDKFQGVVKSNIHRLVVTEMGHAAEEATAKFYKDSDIKQYQYLATLETHTCEACAHLDERIFDVKDKREGINYPLMHPYCRCTTMGYIENLPDITTRWSRDPITGKGRWVRNQPYAEWAKNNGIKLLDYQKFIKLSAPKLSIDEERAIRRYVSSDSYKINFALRSGNSLNDQQKKMVKDLDAVLNKMPYYTDDKPLQRDYFFDDEGKRNFLKELYNGWFEDPAYISTSKIHYGEGTEQIHVIIKKSKSGRDITQFNENEQEVLFPRNTKFRITRAYKKDGVITLEWEER